MSEVSAAWLWCSLLRQENSGKMWSGRLTDYEISVNPGKILCIFKLKIKHWFLITYSNWVEQLKQTWFQLHNWCPHSRTVCSNATEAKGDSEKQISKPHWLSAGSLKSLNQWPTAKKMKEKNQIYVKTEKSGKGYLPHFWVAPGPLCGIIKLRSNCLSALSYHVCPGSLIKFRRRLWTLGGIALLPSDW